MPEITIAGRIAWRAMREGARGRVRAVFERSFYIDLDGQWTCVGPPRLGAGPLNALWHDSGAVRLPRRDDPVSIAAGTLVVAARPFARLRLGPEPPPAVARPWTAATLARGLRQLERVAEPAGPGDGLGCLISGRIAGSRYAAAAVLPVAHLNEIVVSRMRADRPPHFDPAKLVPLLGLGPGLTPSGDDLLGGALVALTAIGFLDLRDAIWTGVRPYAAAGTNDIARAHLAAAAEGECAAALDEAVEALLSGGASLEPALQAVAAVGHTSGWDALAGVVIVLRAAAAGQASAEAA